MITISQTGDFSIFFQNSGLSWCHDFFNFKILTVSTVKRVNMCVTVPNFVAISQAIVEIWLSMAALWNSASHYIFPCGFFFYLSSSFSLWSPYGIGQTVIFWKGQEGKIPHSTKFSGDQLTVAEIWWCFNFSKWRPSPSWIFEISKFW